MILNVDGGGWLNDNICGWRGLLFATGPVGFGVGIACAVIGFSDSQGW